MKAAVMYRTHAPLRIEDLDQDPPKQGEVRVRTMAAGRCASDHHVIEGKMTYPLPVVLGHEGAGLVEEVGSGVTRFSPGDRVILSFQSSCGRCSDCRRGEGNLCDTHRNTPFTMFDGTVRLHNSDGTDVRQMQKLGVFAESLIAPQEACQILPDQVPWESAALIGCAVTTGVGGVLNTPGIQPGDTIAIFGAGGVGLNAIQGARLLNAARIIVVDIVDHKLEFAYKFGATDIINSLESDPVEEIKDMTSGGVDFAYDTFGSSQVVRQVVNSIRKGGTGVLIGLPASGDDAPIDVMDMVRVQKNLVSALYGRVTPHLTFERILDFYQRGKIDIDSLITRRYTLDDINQGFADLARGEDGRGVISYTN